MCLGDCSALPATRLDGFSAPASLSLSPPENAQGCVVPLRKPAARHRRARKPIEFEVPGRGEMLAEIRARVVKFARSMPFNHEQIEDIRLAVGEASANAIRHGRAPGSCKIHVKMERRPGCLKVRISDQGCGFDPGSVTVPPPGSLRAGGRGIMLMRALVDKVDFRFASPGTCVELTKRF